MNCQIALLYPATVLGDLFPNVSKKEASFDTYFIAIAFFAMN
jgi:hypothetical protein